MIKTLIFLRLTMKIIGIDPGTATTGYGVIEAITTNKFRLLTFGTVKTKASDPLAHRIHQIYLGISKIIDEHKPTVMSIESIFYSENVKTALTLGHTRGVLMLAGAMHNLDVHEYTPREVKQSVVGNGNASKEQVQYMIKTLLGLKEIPKPNDAADGCALAMCYLNRNKLNQQKIRTFK
jgi:crossover junction endodeoxyribonuclease RuvC